MDPIPQCPGPATPPQSQRYQSRNRLLVRNQRLLPTLVAMACLLLGLLSWVGWGLFNTPDTTVSNAEAMATTATAQRPASLSWEHHAQTLAQLPLQPSSLQAHLAQIRLSTKPVQPIVRKVVTPPPRPLAELMMPVALSQVSSPFGQRGGRMHQGVDYAAPMGTGIRAAQDGRVRFAGWQAGYGQLLVIEHVPGFETRYAHCARLRVRKGQRVKQGDLIATVGNTGHSTGPHLHFEVWRQGVVRNPAGFVKVQTLIASHERATGAASG